MSWLPKAFAKHVAAGDAEFCLMERTSETPSETPQKCLIVCESTRTLFRWDALHYWLLVSFFVKILPIGQF